MFRWYYDNDDLEIVGDMEKLDLWARVYINQVQVNLCDYYEWWGWKLANETKALCSELPDLDEDLLEGIVPETEHVNCPEG